MTAITPFNKLKIIAHSNKIFQLLEGKIPAPVRIVLEPTNLCNHNCFFCSYTNFRSENKVFLPNEKLFELAKDFKKLGVKSVSLVGGGEPMIHPDIYDLIRWFYKNKIFISITTNGSSIREAEIDTIVRASTYIRVSLNAASTETHNLVNAPKNDQFERIINNIEKLRIHRDKVGANMLIGIRNAIHDKNFHEIEHMVALAEKLKVDYIMFAAVLWEFAASRESIDIAHRKIEELKKKSRIKISHSFYKEPKRTPKCISNPLIGTISANGDMYLCGFMDHADGAYKIGNVYEERFINLWGSKKHYEVYNSQDPEYCTKYICKMKEYDNVIRDVFVDDKMHIYSI
ncbi:MAG: radical SAM protein [Nitrospiraceae bacterium]|nr:MAG: radical SAM protein [Nitrospiraceae bacterium]